MNELIENETTEVNLPVMVQPHMRLIELAVNSGADIVKLERLMDLQERYEANQAKKDFNAAMSDFQSLLPVIEKSGIVDYTTSKGRTYYEYAKLEDIAFAIRPALKETGISYRFTQKQDNAIITVACIVTHSSGHQEVSTLGSTADFSGGKDAIKSLASTLSYLRRYTLTGSLGIVVGGEDNDGGLPEEIKKGEENCYPAKDFKKTFPNWEKAILTNMKTADQIVEQGNKNGIVFSEEQLKSIYNVGNA